jgi:hypothetical protein
MAATDAKAIPVKNAALRITFPIFDADGDLVTGATGLDSEVSKDAAAFADCTNEATEIGATGMYYLDLTASEMDADTVTVIVKTSTSGAKTTPIVLYTAARSVNDLAYPTTSGRSIDVTDAGEVGIDLDNAAGTLDAAQFGADAFTAAKFASDVGAEIAAAVWDLATAGHVTAGTFGAQVKTLLDAIAAYIDTEVASILAAVDTEVAAIKAKTDNLPAAPAAVGDVPSSSTIADAVWDEILSGHTTAGSAGRALQIDTGVAQAGAVGSITLAAGASATDSYYVGQVVVIVAGTGAGQARPISAYVGATKVATIATNWGTTPDNTSRYVILAN